MSPFDLTGPQFLVFYIAVGIAVTATLAYLRNAAESGDPPKVNLADPYTIASLRGGRNEVLRIATVSLIDRGLLKVGVDSRVSAVSPNAIDGVRLPLERQVLAYFNTPTVASKIFSAHDFDKTTHRYENDLEQMGLLPDGEVKSARLIRLGVALAILWTLALVKIAIALERGRTNIQFLIVLAIVFSVIVYKAANPRQTRKGKAFLAGLKTLFGALKKRASSLRPKDNPNELALLGAVFGIAAIPRSVFPHAKALYPKASSSGDSSGCGSSCGSSCGGGGCGGGCGGCGS